MALSPSTIKSANKSRRKPKRLGRGNASGKGSFSARGLKGQRSRSGGKSGGQKRGFKASLQKIPKLRGFNSPYPRKETVTLAILEKFANEKQIVNPAFLTKVGIIRTPKNGVKIVARGELKKKLKIEGCMASKNAVELIEKAGGSVKF